jgi:hypothetical protein
VTTKLTYALEISRHLRLVTEKQRFGVWFSLRHHVNAEFIELIEWGEALPRDQRQIVRHWKPPFTDTVTLNELLFVDYLRGKEFPKDDAQRKWNNDIHKTDISDIHRSLKSVWLKKM